MSYEAMTISENVPEETDDYGYKKADHQSLLSFSHYIGK